MNPKTTSNPKGVGRPPKLSREQMAEVWHAHVTLGYGHDRLVKHLGYSHQSIRTALKHMRKEKGNLTEARS